MTKQDSVPVIAKPLIRKRIWLPLLFLIAFVAALFIPQNEVQVAPESASQGDYLESFLHDGGNGFHDLLFAARISRRLDLKQAVADKRDLNEQFSSMCDMDAVNDCIYPEIEKLVDDNWQTFEAIDRFVGKSSTVPPVTSMNAGLPYLAEFRELARLVVASGKIKENRDCLDGAYRDYLTALKIGQGASKGGVLIHGLVGVAIDTMALQAMRPALDRLDAAQLEQLIKELAQAEAEATAFVEVIRPEHRLISQWREMLADRDYVAAISGNALLFWPEVKVEGPYSAVAGNINWLYVLANQGRMRRTMDDYIGQSERLALAPYGSAEEREIMAYLDSPDGQVMNNEYLSQIAPGLDRAKDAFKRRDAYYRGLRLRAAQELFEIRYGDLLDLNSLVTSGMDSVVTLGILDSLPIDPFSGQPFKMVDGKIYSFGHDLDDDQAAVSVINQINGEKADLMGDGDIVF